MSYISYIPDPGPRYDDHGSHTKDSLRALVDELVAEVNAYALAQVRYHGLDNHASKADLVNIKAALHDTFHDIFRL